MQPKHSAYTNEQSRKHQVHGKDIRKIGKVKVNWQGITTSSRDAWTNWEQRAITALAQMAAHYAAFAATVRWVFPASRILYRWYQHPEVFTNRNTPAILGWGQRRIRPDRSSRWQWIQSCSSHLRLPKPATKETKLFSVKQSCRKSRFGWWVTSNTLQTDCILTWRCIKTLVSLVFISK